MEKIFLRHLIHTPRFHNQDPHNVLGSSKTESYLGHFRPTQDHVTKKLEQGFHILIILVESILQSPISSPNGVISGGQKFEDIKVNQSVALYFGVINDIKHIQIIKNCDLDVLRELGSKTFGAMYHDKWILADVAVKRIHDIYFAGKFWIQERTDGPGGSFAAIVEYMIDGPLRSAYKL